MGKIIDIDPVIAEREAAKERWRQYYTSRAVVSRPDFTPKADRSERVRFYIVCMMMLVPLAVLFAIVLGMIIY